MVNYPTTQNSNHTHNAWEYCTEQKCDVKSDKELKVVENFPDDNN